jgi:PAS domain S-box-containing protein
MFNKMKGESKKGKGNGARRASVGANGRKSSQNAEWESNFNSALIDTVPALVFVLDSEARIVHFNRECREVTGFDGSEVQGRAIWDVLLVPEEIDVVKRAFGSLRLEGEPHTYENHWQCKSGERRLISWQNTPVRGQGKEPQWIIGAGIDITDRRREKRAL